MTVRNITKEGVALIKKSEEMTKTDKLTIWQEIIGGDLKTSFCVYKNEKPIKAALSSMEVEDLRKIYRMVNGLSHKLWHTLHFKLYKCCPICKVKIRGKR